MVQSLKEKMKEKVASICNITKYRIIYAKKNKRISMWGDNRYSIPDTIDKQNIGYMPRYKHNNTYLNV